MLRILRKPEVVFSDSNTVGFYLINNKSNNNVDDDDDDDDSISVCISSVPWFHGGWAFQNLKRI